MTVSLANVRENYDEEVVKGDVCSCCGEDVRSRDCLIWRGGAPKFLIICINCTSDPNFMHGFVADLIHLKAIASLKIAYEHGGDNYDQIFKRASRKKLRSELDSQRFEEWAMENAPEMHKARDEALKRFNAQKRRL